MSTTLFTFLGRPSQEQAGKGGYRKTRYEFSDGDRSEEVAFLGWPLQKRLRPKRMVIMGTAGSSWDHVFEGDLDFAANAEQARETLIQAVHSGLVGRALLEPLERPLSEHIGCETRLVLIPYCRTEEEQVELLRIMAEHVAESDEVDIDVTHGFRHLPMIALLAALHLQVVRKAEVRNIWYGEFDPDTAKASVHNLVGLLRIADWLQALHTYEKDGDYSVFAPLFGRPGVLLDRAAFFERTINPVKAREALSTWSSSLNRIPSGDPAALLFRDELESRVSWFRRDDRALWEKELAWCYLRQRDYLRAAIFALEAAISRNVRDEAGAQIGDYDARSQAKDDLIRMGNEHFRALNSLRNALVHGARPKGWIEAALQDETQLRARLEELLSQIEV